MRRRDEAVSVRRSAGTWPLRGAQKLLFQQILDKDEQRNAHQGEGDAAFGIGGPLEQSRGLEVLRPAQTHGGLQGRQIRLLAIAQHREQRNKLKQPRTGNCVAAVTAAPLLPDSLPEMDEADLMQMQIELSTSQQFEMERLSRVIDATVDPDELRQLTKQLLHAWHTQRAATHWFISQQTQAMDLRPELL